MNEGNRPRLSFCTIARNEAKNIERCLESVKPIVHEMIVVDTGSTDETAALAERLGAAVFHVPWCDDFAASRNAAVEHASGEWILWLDADEELLPECRPMITALAARDDLLACMVQRQEVERVGQTSGFIEMRQLRLWRNEPRLRFIGRCHPHFGVFLDQLKAESGRLVADTPVRIRHTGYRPQLMSAKLERGARLLQLELEDRPGQLYYEIELARTWCVLGDSRGRPMMDSLITRMIEEANPETTEIPRAASILEEFIRSEPPDSARALVAARFALRVFPKSPPVLAAIAELHFRRQDLAESAALQQRLIALAESGDYDRSLAFASHLFGDRPYLNLAVCLHQLGRLEDAEKWYRKLLRRSPNHPGALHNLAVLRKQRAVQATGRSD